MKIGFFDSGIGGLTILHATRAQLPLYDYIFLGDTKNVPYGDKTEDEIYTLTKNAVTVLFEKGALLVIVACNTASAETLRKLQDTMLTGTYTNRKLLGVIVPTIEALIESGSREALLIGTRRTTSSQKYERELVKLNSNIRLHTLATPELVPLIESGNIFDACTALENAIVPQEGEIDTIILGCTHYTVLKKHARKTYTQKIISQDEVIPQKLQAYLEKHTEIETKLTRNKSIEIVLTDNRTYEGRIA